MGLRHHLEPLGDAKNTTSQILNGFSAVITDLGYNCEDGSGYSTRDLCCSGNDIGWNSNNIFVFVMIG